MKHIYLQITQFIHIPLYAPSIFFVTVQIHILRKVDFDHISDQNPEPEYYYWDDSVPAILTNGVHLIIKYYLMYQ